MQALMYSSVEHQHESSIVIKPLPAVPATPVANKFAISQG